MKRSRLAIPIIAFLALGSAATESTSPEPAVASERAAHSLLLGVAKAGPRLVAVGHRGHVVLSDDGGESWRQAKSVPTRATAWPSGPMAWPSARGTAAGAGSASRSWKRRICT